MAGDQLWREQALAQNTTCTIKVGKQRIEQLGALNQSRLDGAPFGAGDQHWPGVQGPRPLRPLGIIVDVVGDAVLVQEMAHLVPTALELRRPQRLERTD